MLFLLCISYTTSISQISIEAGSGVDFISQNSYLKGISNSQFISIQHSLSKDIGIGLGYRHCSNISVGLSNFSNLSEPFDPYTSGREDGRIDSDEVYLFSYYSAFRFNFKVGLGYVISGVNTDLALFSVDQSDDTILDSQMVNKKYENGSFIRGSLHLNYQIPLYQGLSLSPYFDFLLDFGSRSKEYALESIGTINAPFNSIEVVDEFNTDTKLIYHEPKYFIFGLALSYEL